jgi:1-acyl-sn-glycerol-3-phosphate acyltransferase
MRRLRTILSWSGAALVLVAIASVLVVCPFLFRRERWEPLLKKLCRALARAFGYRVRTSGLENLPQAGGFVLVCNHVNLIDAFLLFGFLPGSFRGLEQLQHFSWPVYGALIRRFGNIALDQSGGGRTAGALMTAGEALKNGISLLILPEGHRTRDGRFGPFMRGAFRLANRTGAVLVPVVQRGAWEVFHKGDRHVSPGLVDLIVLAPWTVQRRAGLDDSTFCARVRQEMETIYSQPQGPECDCPDSPDAVSSIEDNKEAPCA